MAQSMDNSLDGLDVSAGSCAGRRGRAGCSTPLLRGRGTTAPAPRSGRPCARCLQTDALGGKSPCRRGGIAPSRAGSGAGTRRGSRSRARRCLRLPSPRNCGGMRGANGQGSALASCCRCAWLQRFRTLLELQPLLDSRFFPRALLLSRQLH